MLALLFPTYRPSLPEVLQKIEKEAVPLHELHAPRRRSIERYGLWEPKLQCGEEEAKVVAGI